MRRPIDRDRRSRCVSPSSTFSSSAIAAARDRLRPLRRRRRGRTSMPSSTGSARSAWPEDRGRLRGGRRAVRRTLSVAAAGRDGAERSGDVLHSRQTTTRVRPRCSPRCIARFPTGAFADRAAWKAGLVGVPAATTTAKRFGCSSRRRRLRRADYRPSWLYWAARAHEELGEREAALAGYRADRRRLSELVLRPGGHARDARLQGGARLASSARAHAAPLVLVAGRAAGQRAASSRRSCGAALYDDAVAELRKVTGGRQHAAHRGHRSPTR